MLKIKDYSEYIGLIIAVLFTIFCFFILINKINECENKGGVFIQGRCVKKEVIINESN